ncbi:hypothetical protein ACUXIZ_003613 [Cytobacillus horneckiae]
MERLKEVAICGISMPAIAAFFIDKKVGYYQYLSNYSQK